MTRQFSHCPVNLISNSFFWLVCVELLRQDRWIVSITKVSCLRSRIVWGLHTDAWWTYFTFLYFCLMSSSSISDSAVELCNCSNSWLLSGSLNCMCSVLILENDKESLFCCFSYFSLCFLLAASAMWYFVSTFPSHDAFLSVLIDSRNL